MPSTLDSQPCKSSDYSRTSGTTSPTAGDETRRGPIGPGRGNAGVVKTSSTMDLRRLESLPDAEADREISRWLPLSVTLEPVYARDLENVVPVKYRARGPGAQAALAILAETMTPASPEVVEDALTELALTTRGRSHKPDEAAARAAAYLARLSVYPADVVISCCRQWSDNSPWWPEWAELRELCEARMRRRRLMAEALI